jgi:hypothetical protein
MTTAVVSPRSTSRRTPGGTSFQLPRARPPSSTWSKSARTDVATICRPPRRHTARSFTSSTMLSWLLATAVPARALLARILDELERLTSAEEVVVLDALAVDERQRRGRDAEHVARDRAGFTDPPAGERQVLHVGPGDQADGAECGIDGLQDRQQLQRALRSVDSSAS